MTWFKVDDRFAFHSKALAAGNEALGAWVRAGAWCSGELTDGAIPEHVAATIAPLDVWARLVAARLVERTESGYRMHDFGDYNPSADAVRAERAADKARKAAGRSRQGRSPDGRIAPPPPSDRNPPGRPPGFRSDVRPDTAPPSAGPVPSRPDPRDPERGSGSPARVRATPEPPAPAETATPPEWFSPTEQAIADTLARSECLRGLARSIVPRIAAQTNGDGNAGPHRLADVLKALRDVDANEGNRVAGGDLPRTAGELSGVVFGFIKRVRCGEADEPAATPRPAAPSPAPLPLAHRLLTFDDPPRAPRPPRPAPEATVPGDALALVAGIGLGGRP